jgi:site-specific recombinase XerD
MPATRPSVWSGLSSAPAPVRDLAERYLAYRRANSSPATVQRLRGIVARWIVYLLQRGLAPAAATRAEADDFCATWPWAPNTKRQAICDLRTFHAWLVEEGHQARNPWRGVRGPRRPVRIPRVLMGEELAAMDGALARASVRDARDRAMLAFLRATGCRSGEMRSLGMADLDLGRRRAIVRGKGDKERYVFLDEPAVAAIQLWLRVRDAWAPSAAGLVFVGRHGGRVNPTVLRDALLRAAGRAELNRHVHAHVLRHTFASRMRERGVDLRVLQEMLGHADLSTTQIYTHVAPRQIQREYDRATRRGRRAGDD